MTATVTTPGSSTPSESSGGGRAALLGGLTTLIAALTAVATVSGEVGRMFRNHAVLTSIALILVLGAILCGLLSQAGASWSKSPWLLVGGSVSLVSSMACGLIAEVKTLSLSDRPTVTSALTRNGSTMTFTAHVQGRNAKAHDQIVVTVYGIAPTGSRTPPVYYAKTGPNTSGDLAQDIQLDVDTAKYDGLYLTALLVPEDERPPTVDCDGDIVGPDGQDVTARGSTGPEHVPFRPGNHAPLVGCLTLQFS